MQPDILEELYQNYYDAAYAYTLSLCKNREDTEDLVADAFVKALFSYGRYILGKQANRIVLG